MLSELVSSTPAVKEHQRTLEAVHLKFLFFVFSVEPCYAFSLSTKRLGKHEYSRNLDASITCMPCGVAHFAHIALRGGEIGYLEGLAYLQSGSRELGVKLVRYKAEQLSNSVERGELWVCLHVRKTKGKHSVCTVLVSNVLSSPHLTKSTLHGEKAQLLESPVEEIYIVYEL